jgi:hypothetical protein
MLLTPSQASLPCVHSKAPSLSATNSLFLPIKALTAGDRQVYVTEVRDGTPSTIKAYDELRGNFFMGNYYGQEAVDNDDGSWCDQAHSTYLPPLFPAPPKLLAPDFLTAHRSYYETHHNFFAYGDNGMKNDFKGHDNHHHDNVYAFINKGLGIDPQLPGHQDFYYNNKVVLVNSNGYAGYDCSCNVTDCPVLHDNQLYTPTGTMGTICGQTLAQRQARGVDVGTRVGPWPEDVEIISWARELLDLPAQ